MPSARSIANIAPNDAMILPYDANPGRIEFSERTGRCLLNGERQNDYCCAIPQPMERHLQLRSCVQAVRDLQSLACTRKATQAARPTERRRAMPQTAARDRRRNADGFSGASTPRRQRAYFAVLLKLCRSKRRCATIFPVTEIRYLQPGSAALFHAGGASGPGYRSRIDRRIACSSGLIAPAICGQEHGRSIPLADTTSGTPDHKLGVPKLRLSSLSDVARSRRFQARST
jgi:hypothetical protein